MLHLILYAIGGFLFAFCIFVPAFEWLLHRHAMHTEKEWWLFNGLYRLHDRAHHIIFDHDRHYTKTESLIQRAPSVAQGLSFNGWFMFGIIAIHSAIYGIGLIPLIFFLERSTVALLICGLLLGSVAFGFFQIKFHYWYHAADGTGYTKLARVPFLGNYFLFMCEHHRRHHKDTSVNLNTLVPTVDLAIHWFRTLFGASARAKL